jgi:hypothetical protein
VLGLLGECSEDEDSFHYSIRGSTTKVDDLGIEFLSSNEENWVLVKFLPLNYQLYDTPLSAVNWRART